MAARIGGPDEDTISRWISAKTNEFVNADAPASRQHFDIWQFQNPSRVRPLHSAAQLRQGLRLIVWCRDCRHQVEPDPAELSERYGAGTNILWKRRLVCSRCGSRQLEAAAACGEFRTGGLAALDYAGGDAASCRMARYFARFGRPGRAQESPVERSLGLPGTAFLSAPLRSGASRIDCGKRP